MPETLYRNRVFDFISAVDQTTSVEDAWFQTTCFMTESGASQVGIKLGFTTPEPFFLWTVPQWVREMYLETVYPDNDPRLEHCTKNSTPYFYGCGFWKSDETLPAQRRLYDKEISSVSMRSMVSIPFHSADKNQSGIFSYACNFQREAFQDMYSAFGAEMHLAGLAASNHISALVQKKESESAGLTRRECECLLWLSRGLRNDQISERMGIRRVTVEFHLANARQKLNAKTREQALVKAIQLNIIQP